MKLIKKLYIELSYSEKSDLISNARDMDNGISTIEFIEYIERLINSASMMIENELDNKGK